MKQEVSTPILAGIIVAVVLLIALIGWKVLGPSGGHKIDEKTAHMRKDQKDGG